MIERRLDGRAYHRLSTPAQRAFDDWMFAVTGEPFDELLAESVYMLELPPSLGCEAVFTCVDKNDRMKRVERRFPCTTPWPL